MFVEIGHFYTNEKFNVESLNYLREQRFAEDDILVLFIDDYTFPNAKELDVDNLRLECEKILNRSVVTYFESQMADKKYYDRALATLEYEKLERVSINGTPTELRYNGKKIFDYSTKRPTCLMLSYTWTMYRLGQISFWQQEEHQVLTVIDKKYMKLEQRVFLMVSEHLRHKIFYRYF